MGYCISQKALENLYIGKVYNNFNCLAKELLGEKPNGQRQKRLMEEFLSNHITYAKEVEGKRKLVIVEIDENPTPIKKQSGGAHNVKYAHITQWLLLKHTPFIKTGNQIIVEYFKIGVNNCFLGYFKSNFKSKEYITATKPEREKLQRIFNYRRKMINYLNIMITSSLTSLSNKNYIEFEKVCLKKVDTISF